MTIKKKIILSCIITVLFFTGLVSYAQADYYPEAAALSTNLLTGLSDVAQITTFKADATIPASTTLSIQFSQDGIDWRNHNNIKNGWDTLSTGANTIELRLLDWKTANFYYHVRFTTSDPTVAASLNQAEVDYSDTYTPYTPPWDGGYYIQSSIASADLLSGTDIVLNGAEQFGYAISSLPSGTSVQAQFSKDNVTWYDSSGTLGGWDTLLAGTHLDNTAVDLSALDWKGAEKFYYKLKMITNGSVAPIVSSVALLQNLAQINSVKAPAGSKMTINMSLANKLTEGLVGYWSFDGPDISGTTAYDRSGNDNNGTIHEATPTIGKNGQALKFDGVDDYVDVGTMGNFGSDMGNNNLTITSWIKSSATDTVLSLWGTLSDGCNTALFVNLNSDTFDNLKTGGIKVYIRDEDCIAISAYVNADTGITNGNWHQLTVVFDTSNNIAQIFIDGISQTIAYYHKDSPKNFVNFQYPMLFGAVNNRGTPDQIFNGKIDDVRIYNRALSIDEVKDLYKLGRVTIKK